LLFAWLHFIGWVKDEEKTKNVQILYVNASFNSWPINLLQYQNFLIKSPKADLSIII